MTETQQDLNIHETMDDRWEFNEEVTRVFDEMLDRSIPQLQTMRRTVHEVGRRFDARGDGLDPWVVDLGCSRGGAIAPFVEEGWAATGFEVSKPMVAAARDRFSGSGRVKVIEHDLRQTFGWTGKQDGMEPRMRPNVVLSILTLIFTPINHRQRIVQDAYDWLLPGGSMIVVEKVLGRGATLDRLMVELYHESKAAAGYSREEIDRKAMALEGVQVPVTAEWNVDLLRGAGFREVDCFWRWCNFAGWVAVK